MNWNKKAPAGRGFQRRYRQPYRRDLDAWGGGIDTDFNTLMRILKEYAPHGGDILALQLTYQLGLNPNVSPPAENNNGENQGGIHPNTPTTNNQNDWNSDPGEFSTPTGTPHGIRSALPSSQCPFTTPEGRVLGSPVSTMSQRMNFSLSPFQFRRNSIPSDSGTAGGDRIGGSNNAGSSHQNHHGQLLTSPSTMPRSPWTPMTTPMAPPDFSPSTPMLRPPAPPGFTPPPSMPTPPAPPGFTPPSQSSNNSSQYGSLPLFPSERNTTPCSSNNGERDGFSSGNNNNYTSDAGQNRWGQFSAPTETVPISPWSSMPPPPAPPGFTPTTQSSDNSSPYRNSPRFRFRQKTPTSSSTVSSPNRQQDHQDHSTTSGSTHNPVSANNETPLSQLSAHSLYRRANMFDFDSKST